MTFAYRARPGWVLFSVRWDRAGRVIERKWRPVDQASGAVQDHQDKRDSSRQIKPSRGLAREPEQGSLL